MLLDRTHLRSRYLSARPPAIVCLHVLTGGSYNVRKLSRAAMHAVRACTGLNARILIFKSTISRSCYYWQFAMETSCIQKSKLASSWYAIMHRTSTSTGTRMHVNTKSHLCTSYPCSHTSIHSGHTFLISIAILGEIFGFERSWFPPSSWR